MKTFFCWCFLLMAAALTGCFRVERDVGGELANTAYTTSPVNEIPAALTTEEAVRQLLEGNARFVHKEARMHQMPSHDLATHPFVAVITRDSQIVDPEVLFDQPKGSVPVWRWQSGSKPLQELEEAISQHIKLVVILAYLKYDHLPQTADRIVDQKLDDYFKKLSFEAQASSKSIASAVSSGRCQIMGAVQHAETNRVKFAFMPDY
jgi:hypothetical protein